MRHVLVTVLTLLLLTGCTTAISTTPAQDIAAALPGAGTIATGLQNAAWNLDQAVAIGVLDATDPAPGCLHGVLKDLGLEPVPGVEAKRFTPKVTDLISAGSVAYIRLRQAQKASASGITVPVDCKAIVGSFVLDAARGGVKVLPGGGLLPSLR